MFSFVSTREFAHISLFAFVFIYSLAKSDEVRKSTKKLILLVLKPEAFLIFDLFALYEVIVLFIITNLNFWKPIYYKDFIFWIILGGFPTLFQDRLKSIKDFKEMILKHFFWSTIVEYITGLITFSLFTEYLICIFGTLVVLFVYHAETEGHTCHLGKTIVVIFMLALIVATIFKGNTTFKEYGNIETLVKLLIPIGFYCSSIPYLYMYFLIARYQELFTVITILEERNMSPANRKKDALLWCGFSIDRLKIFRQLYPMYPSFTREQFISISSGQLTIEQLMNTLFPDD